MRIAYCTNVRLPSERAHGHQVAAVCDALAKLGHGVTVFAPRRQNVIRNDFWTFHRADPRIQLRYFGLFDPIDMRFVPKVAQLHLLNAQMTFALRRALRREPFDLLYTRTSAFLPTLLATRIPTIFECHALPQRGRERVVAFCNRCALVVCLTTPMRDALVRLGVDPGRMIVEGDAVNLEMFAHLPSAEEAKKALSSDTRFDHELVSALPLIGYAGQLTSMGLSKGVETLLDAADILKDKGRHFILAIAGPPVDDEYFMNRVRAYRYAGYLPHDRVPQFLAACDVLVYPAPKSDHPFYRRDTSPLKIFEYMAAGRPIVAADLPPVRDVLDEETAFFCEPGNPASLAKAIEETLNNSLEAQRRARNARERVSRHTWEGRMGRILHAMRGDRVGVGVGTNGRIFRFP